MSKENTIVGIDLGTSNSAISVMEGGNAIIISNSEGKRTTPSIIGFTDGDIKIGDPAKRQAVTNPDGTIYSIKRFIGKEYTSLKEDQLNVSYKVEKSDKNIPVVRIGEKLYTPQELSAMILQKMKKTAEDYLGHEIERAVITVPAYFNDQERQATIEAGKIAGLKVERIINEPTAASLAYGLDKKEIESKVLVFDCGGGTHDVSILEIGDGVFEVLSTEGDTHLGGDDFDNAIIDWIVDGFKSEYNMDLTKDTMAYQRLREMAEKAKIELSSTSQTDINLPYITVIDGNPVHFVKTLTRAEFDRITSSLVERAIKCASSALKNASLKASDIDEVILVGGTTRIPSLQEAIEKLIGKVANKSVNPDEVVAMGSAIQGGVLAGNVSDVLLLDVTPLDLGIETMGGIMTKLIEANTTIPTKKTETFSTASDNQSAVDIHILQGGRAKASDNKSLGRFQLTDIPPAPRGVPQIEVSFDIDANGVISVSAIDKATGKEANIKIQANSQLSDEEIERMRSEAEANAEADQLFKEKIEKINQADSLVFQTEKQIKEFGDKISNDDKTSLENRLSTLKVAIKEEDIESIDSEVEELNKIWGEISTKLYQESQSDVNSNEDVVNEESSGVEVEDVDFDEIK